MGWYSPYKITYTYSQVCWLVINIRELRIADWPPDPEGKSSYIDPKIVVKGGEYKAYTENIGAIAGTVERRLLKTGMDGAMAYLYYAVDLDFEEIGKLHFKHRIEIEKRIDIAIRYCCGKWDKKSSYFQYNKILRDYAQRKQRKFGG